jgi:general secretion pathway protein D
VERSRTIARTILLAIALAILAGCVSQSAFRQAELAAKREDWDGAVLGYSKALGLDPGNDRYGAALLRAKLRASAVHFERGKRYLQSQQLELAITELEQTIFLDPENQYAKVELDRAKLKLDRLHSSPSEIEAAKAEARKKSLAPPKLSPTSNLPIVVKFKDQEIGKIYDAVSHIAGINFLYDDKLDQDPKLKKSVDLAGVNLEQAMDILMMQFKHFYKVIDEHTLFIAQDNRAKRTELEDKVIRTFFLSNGDTKQVNTLLRSLLEVRKIAENPQLNSITIKDSPDVVEVAEKIIDANDKAKAELIIDCELLEINRATLQNLGIDLSSKTLALTFMGGGVSLPLNGLNALRQQGNWTIGPIPGAIINFLKSDSDTKTISKPQVRVTEGEKAELHIGDRVPIPTTTFNTSNTVGGNIVPVTSFTYQNTGIQLTIEPRVHHNREVTLKLNVEVSSVSGSVTVEGGVNQPIIGTRQIQTVVRLKDGETNMLSGLIKEDETLARSGIPGISSIPGINRLFGNQSHNHTVLDIILTLTPHIIRVPDISETDLEAIWVGTEDNTKLRTKSRNAFGETPFGGGDDVTGSAAPAGTAAPNQPSPSGPGSNPSSPSSGKSPLTAPIPAMGSEEDEEEEEFDDMGEEGDEEELPPEEAQKKEQAPTSVAQVILVSPRNTYAVGETVPVQVQLVGGQNIGSVPFHLRFNPAVLEFMPPAVEGDFLSQAGGPTVFVATEVQGAGEIVVGASRVGTPTGASGAGLLASFQFRAKAPGSSTLSFTGSMVRDPNANNLPSSFTTSIINVQAR